MDSPTARKTFFYFCAAILLFFQVLNDRHADDASESATDTIQWDWDWKEILMKMFYVLDWYCFLVLEVEI